MNLHELIAVLDDGERLIVKNFKGNIIFDDIILKKSFNSIINLIISKTSQEDDLSIKGIRVAGGAISVTLNEYKD